MLLHDHGISPLGHHTACKKAYSLARYYGHGLIASIDMPLYGQGLIVLDISVAYGIAVHRAVISRWDIKVGIDHLGIDAPKGLRDRDTLRAYGHGSSLYKTILCRIKI